MPTSPCPEAKSLSLSVSTEAWEKVVSFPPDPSQEDGRLAKPDCRHHADIQKRRPGP